MGATEPRGAGMSAERPAGRVFGGPAEKRAERPASERPAERPAFHNAIAQVSSAPIAAVGMALAVFLFEVNRMSSFQNVVAGSLANTLFNLASLPVLALCIAAFERRATFRLHRHTAVCFGVAGVFSFMLLWTFGAIPLPVAESGLAMVVGLRVCETILLLCWAETLMLLSARQAASIVALALIILGLVNALSSVIDAGSIGVVIAMLPFLSLVCLYWFRDHATIMSDELGGADAGSPTVSRFDRSLIPGRHPADRAIAALNFLLPLLLFPVVFGFIHYAWIPSQDSGTASMLIQLSAALGSSLGGALLYALTAAFWGRRKLALYNMFTLAFLLLAFALVGFSAGIAPYPYVMLLNIAQKITFFFIWIMPFLIPCKRSPLTVWCLALGLYQIGKAASNIAMTTLDGQGYALFAVAAIVVALTANILGIVLDQGTREWDGPLGAGALAGAAEEAVGPTVEGPAGGQAAETGAACSDPERQTECVCAALAQRYHLSRREEDVLRLLAQGAVACDVAEALVISNSTAKTHMRNLYAKMGVHSQTELVLLIAQTRQD